MRTYSFAEYKDAADVIKSRISIVPEIGLVLGSGLGQLADEVEGIEPGTDPVIIDYKDIPGWPASTVFGHKGRLVIGKLGGRNVVVQQGRAHFYEGYSLSEVTFAVRVMKLLGVNTLVLTNAAGGLNVFFHPGDDHEIEHINGVLEVAIEDLSYSRNKHVIMLLNEYPIIATHAHTRPFKQKWLNVTTGLFLPTGIFFYFRMIRFRFRLYKDLQHILQTNEKMIERIHQLL